MRMNAYPLLHRLSYLKPKTDEAEVSVGRIKCPTKCDETIRNEDAEHILIKCPSWRKHRWMAYRLTQGIWNNHNLGNVIMKNIIDAYNRQMIQLKESTKLLNTMYVQHLVEEGMTTMRDGNHVNSVNEDITRRVIEAQYTHIDIDKILQEDQTRGQSSNKAALLEFLKDKSEYQILLRTKRLISLLGDIEMFKQHDENSWSTWLDSQTVGKLLGGQIFNISTIFIWIWSAMFLSLIDDSRKKMVNDIIHKP